MEATIKIDGKTHEVSKGLTSAQTIYGLIERENGCLFLNRSNDIDIPVDSASFLVIKGGESFVTGDISTEDNPPLRNAIQLVFNGEKSSAIPRAKLTGRELKSFDAEHPEGRLFAEIGIGPDAEISDQMIVLVQEGNAFFVIPANDGSLVGDPIDIEDCSRHGRRPPKGQKYRIRIDREKYIVKKEKITGKQILELAGKTPEQWALNRKLRGGRRERIEADEFVGISQPGVERFETVRRQAQQGSERRV